VCDYFNYSLCFVLLLYVSFAHQLIYAKLIPFEEVFGDGVFLKPRAVEGFFEVEGTLSQYNCYVRTIRMNEDLMKISRNSLVPHSSFHNSGISGVHTSGCSSLLGSQKPQIQPAFNAKAEDSICGSMLSRDKLCGLVPVSI
jgi:hypothetical protein